MTKELENKLKINKNTRIINYKSIININKKDKNNNIVKLEQTLICNLITNLNKNKFLPKNKQKITRKKKKRSGRTVASCQILLILLLYRYLLLVM